MKRALSDVLDQVGWFEDDDVLELSAAGTLLIAEYVCAANPVPVLERVIAAEAEIRGHCKRGREFDAIDGSGLAPLPASLSMRHSDELDCGAGLLTCRADWARCLLAAEVSSAALMIPTKVATVGADTAR